MFIYSLAKLEKYASFNISKSAQMASNQQAPAVKVSQCSYCNFVVIVAPDFVTFVVFTHLRRCADQ